MRNLRFCSLKKTNKQRNLTLVNPVSMSRSQDLNKFTLTPKSMLLISMHKVTLKLFYLQMVWTTAVVGEVQGIYSYASNKNRGSPLQTADDSSFKHDLLISEEYFQMGPSGFTLMG